VIKTKSIVRLVLISTLMIAAAPAYSATAMQMWKCEMDDDATEQDVKAGAANWLKAAKKLNGGEQLEAYVYFPIAVNATGETDMMYVITTPTFEEWGKFWDAYGGSEAAKIEVKNEEFVVCPDSVVWESFKVN
jgi:hypothetical protein